MKFTVVKKNIFIISILILAAFLRLYHINYQSLWLDEIHTINEADPALTLKELYQVLCSTDPHPPLYFLLARSAFYLFGHTALTLRLLSAVLGIAGVWSIYILGKELYNKKAGLIAALLLAVNHFHIYYSQDGRPYPLLFLCTTISFYFLVRFIKNPTWRSSVLYGVFAGLMLYSHLFSLFALCSQCAILLYFIIRPYSHPVTAKKMFLYCITSGVVIIIMYLPCFEILHQAASRTSFWIPKPKYDVYIDLIKEFFGNYDVQLFFAGIALLFFFIALRNEKLKKTQPAILKLCGIVLLTWIIITLLIPFVKSYIGLPVIVSRYFINILPAIIVLISIGILQFKNEVLRYAITCILVVLSLYNIFILKRFYDTINKTQFREATNFIIKNNTEKAPVVSSLGWYMPFYLKNGHNDYTLIYESLEDHVAGMIKDNSKIKAFWYIDAHNRPYNPSEPVKQFLDTNFRVKENYEGYDIWTRHYEPVQK